MARIKLPTAIGHLTDYRMSAPRAFTTSAGPFNRVAFAAAHDDPILGVVVNVYHVHWDPRLPQEIARAGSRILAFHVCDWLAPSKHMLLIDIPAIRSLVEATGYDGPIEVEIFSRDDWWRRDPEEVLRIAAERYQTVVSGATDRAAWRTDHRAPGPR